MKRGLSCGELFEKLPECKENDSNGWNSNGQSQPAHAEDDEWNGEIKDGDAMNIFH